jgi:hypothetical protein
MAHAFVWIVVASVLSAFKLEKAVRDGRVVELTGAFSPGILSCVICPHATLDEEIIVFFLYHTGLRKSLSAPSSHGRRMLKRSFTRRPQRDRFLLTVGLGLAMPKDYHVSAWLVVNDPRALSSFTLLPVVFWFILHDVTLHAYHVNLVHNKRRPSELTDALPIRMCDR